jgi:hypothetical protein
MRCTSKKKDRLAAVLPNLHLRQQWRSTFTREVDDAMVAVGGPAARSFRDRTGS